MKYLSIFAFTILAFPAFSQQNVEVDPKEELQNRRIIDLLKEQKKLEEAVDSLSQQNKRTEEAAYYFYKGTRQVNTGWILMGVGTLGVIAHTATLGLEKPNTPLLYLSGASFGIGSILFIVANNSFAKGVRILSPGVEKKFELEASASGIKTVYRF